MTPGFPESLFRRWATRLDAELHLVQDLSGPEPGDDPFADGRYDLGWICSTSYVGLALARPDPSVTLAGVAWVPDDPDNGGQPVYFGDVVVRPELVADGRVSSLADLEGLTVGCNDRVSLSGHYALRWAIDDLGADPDRFVTKTFTGGHHRSLDLLVAGRIDAAVVDSVVRLGRARHDRDVADLVVIDRLGPHPTQPLVARSSLDAASIERVGDRLLAADDDPEIRREMQSVALSRLVAVGPDHYEPVRRRMADAAGTDRPGLSEG